MTNKLYYIRVVSGACLQVAKDKEEAKEKMLRLVGSLNGVTIAREATEQDIKWIRAVGGFVPNL